MGNFKKGFKSFWAHVWEFFKAALPAILIYFCAGTILMMITMPEDGSLTWDGTKLTWTLVCGIVAVAYNGLLAYAEGGNAFKMLVSGNIKRRSMDDDGEGFKMSNHKYAKEYRPWKGFVIGAFAAIFTLVFGIILGCNQSRIIVGEQTEMSWVVLVAILLTGWSILPFYFLNASGIYVSYFVTCAFAVLPIIVSGVLYILGAYGRRRKTIKEQELADKASQEQAQPQKKINYGGLPGTKPKKKK